MHQKLSHILDKLKVHGHQVEDREVDIVETVDANLQEVYGDIGSVIAQIRHDLLALKEKLAEDPLMTLRGSLGKKIEDLDPDIAKQCQHDILTDEVARRNIKKWLENIEKYSLKPNLVRGKRGRCYQSGGLKSIEGTQRQIANPLFTHYQDRMRDLTRGRLICSDLREVVRAGKQLIQDENSGRLWGFNNYYSAPPYLKNGNERFFFAYNIYYLFNAYAPYELQIVSRRAHALGQLNHPILRRSTVELDEAHLNYLKALTLGGHVLDFQDYLAVSKRRR